MWAYSELRSSRFAALYRRRFPDAADLIDKAASGVGFDSLPADEVERLTGYVGVFRPLARALDASSVGHTFVCESWDKKRLEQALTLPAMTDSARCVPFWRFVRSAPKPDQGTAFLDPRNTANQLDDNNPFVQHEPVIAVLHRGRPLLIDGYLRSILFYRHGRADQRLSAWVPDRGPDRMVHRAGNTRGGALTAVAAAPLVGDQSIGEILFPVMSTAAQVASALMA